MLAGPIGLASTALIAAALLLGGCSARTGAAGAAGGGATPTTGASTSSGGAGNGAGGSTGPGGSAGDGGSAGSGATAPAGGPVEIDGVYNARHTGGLPAAGGLSVRDRLLIRSGHLSDITPTGCSQFVALGVETVIDLRETDGATGTAANPDAECVTSAASHAHVELPKLLPPSEGVYLQILAAAEPRLGDIFAALSGAQALPAVVHCVIGRDRANIVMALVLLSLGVPADRIVEDFTTNQDEAVAAEVQAAWIQAVIDHVSEQGGVDAYLLAHGVTGEQLEALRQNALE